MPWVKLDDQFPGHPKVAQLSPAWRPLAVFLHINGLCWCNQYLTDGHIPKSMVSRLGPEVECLEIIQTQGPITARKVAEALVAVGLWEEREHEYVIHDFSLFQPTRREVESRRRHVSTVRKQAGSKGGSKAASKRAANVQQSGEQTTKQMCSPVPDPLREREREQRSSLPVCVPTTPERRAGAWLEQFPVRYFEARGVGYVVNQRRDFDNAVRLAKAVPDDARLDRLTDLFLRADHRDLEHQTRTPGRMLAMLPALEEHLNAHLARRTT